MTISSSTSKIIYDGDGATVVFPYTFPITADADIVVVHTDSDSVETTLTLTADYTVSGAGDASGGNVTLTGTAPAVGEKLTVYREVALTQGLDLVNNDTFDAELVEAAFDKLTMIAQQLLERDNRTLKYAVSTDAGDIDEDVSGTLTTMAGYASDAESAATAAAAAQTAAEAAETGAEAAVSDHAALDTGVHGVTGTVLGTEDVDDIPVDGADTAPISSNWAHDHAATTAATGVVGHAPGTTGASDGDVLTVQADGSGAWEVPPTGTAYDALSPLSASEVSITGATTLTSAAFGKMHVCSGTTADYTVTLPAVSGNGGKSIGFRGASGLTKVVTIDGSGAETIDGNDTFQIWTPANRKIYCNGSSFETISQYGVASLDAALSANQDVAPGTITLIQLSSSSDFWTGTPDYKWTPPAGTYLFYASITAIEPLVDGNYLNTMIEKNGVLTLSGWQTIAVAGQMGVFVSGPLQLNGTDYVQLKVRHNNAVNRELSASMAAYRIGD